MLYSGDLSSKVMFFLAEEVWIGVDLSLQISREEDFDPTRCGDLSWGKFWEFHPIGEGVMGNIVAIKVDSRSFWLHVFICCFFTFVRDCCFNNVIVLLSAVNFTKESHSGGRKFLR